MREILFRGKRKGIGEWVYGYYAYCTDGCEFSHRIHTTFAETYGGEYLSPVWFEVIPETVGQYTGLTDKNGKQIFEGDIVEFESHGFIPNIERGSVIFKRGCYGIEYEDDLGKRLEWGKQFHRIGTVSQWQDMGASGTITYTYELIGNIHDNPELLKGSVKDA